MSSRNKIALFAALLVIAGLSAVFLPLDRWILDIVEWIKGAGIAGVLSYAVLYIGSTLLMLPGSVLTLTAGFVWGPLVGIALVSPISTLAATGAFLLGRSVARDWISSKVAGNERFAAIDRAVAGDGLKVVLLLRLSPMFPFNLLNYALGLTQVSLRDYLLGSFIGMLPGTFMYVYMGSLVTSATELFSESRPDVGAWGQVLYWGGLIATVVVTVLVTRIARRALAQYMTRPTPRV